MKSTNHTIKFYILTLVLLLAVSTQADPVTDAPDMPSEAEPAALKSASHPVKAWDEVLQKEFFFRSIEEQKAWQSLSPGLRVLLLTRSYLREPACLKMVVSRQEGRYTFREIIYNKRTPIGENYRRKEKEKLMKSHVKKNTLLFLPGGETWDLQGDVAIKFPDFRNEAFVKRAMEKAVLEREQSVKKEKLPNDTQRTYLCETFSEAGRDYFRVVIIEPRIYKKIRESVAGDVARGVTDALEGRAGSDAEQKATEMLKTGITQRKEHIIARDTMLPVFYSEYDSSGKKTKFEEYRCIEKLEQLDDALFKVPENNKLLFPKNLREYSALAEKYRQRERISIGKKENKK